MKIQIKDASAGRIEEVIDIDPEMADMGNPHGHRFGMVHRVIASNLIGRRFVHSHEFSSASSAEAFAVRVLVAGWIDLDHWGETFEIYGSQAWEAADQEREFAHQADPATAGTVRDY
jgi:hypothetical protein